MEKSVFELKKPEKFGGVILLWGILTTILGFGLYFYSPYSKDTIGTVISIGSLLLAIHPSVGRMFDRADGLHTCQSQYKK